jgi:hypothetical protein
MSGRDPRQLADVMARHAGEILMQMWPVALMW